MNWKQEIKWWKRTACHQQAWVGCGRSRREGKKRVRLGQPFCWSPKQINQGSLEHTNWITQMGLGVGDAHTWQSCDKAATRVGRPRLQALSEINHPCQPLLAFLLSPHLSFCFSVLVCFFMSSSQPPNSLWLFYSSSLCVSLVCTTPLITDALFLPLFFSVSQFLISTILTSFAFSSCPQQSRLKLDLCNIYWCFTKN